MEKPKNVIIKGTVLDIDNNKIKVQTGQDTIEDFVRGKFFKEELSVGKTYEFKTNMNFINGFADTAYVYGNANERKIMVDCIQAACCLFSNKENPTTAQVMNVAREFYGEIYKKR